MSVHPGWRRKPPANHGEREPHGIPRLLTEREVREILGVSHTTVWKLVREGKLRTVKVERATRFRQADVAAYIERENTRTE